MARRYICDDSNPTFSKWLTERFPQAVEERKQSMEFLKRQADQIDARWTAAWEELFSSLKNEGLIPKDLAYADHRLEIVKEFNQLFLEKKGDGIPNLEDFLRMIRGKGPEQ